MKRDWWIGVVILCASALFWTMHIIDPGTFWPQMSALPTPTPQWDAVYYPCGDGRPQQMMQGEETRGAEIDLWRDQEIVHIKLPSDVFVENYITESECAMNVPCPQPPTWGFKNDGGSRIFVDACGIIFEQGASDQYKQQFKWLYDALPRSRRVGLDEYPEEYRKYFAD
ncbi:MAG: hypothetical protein KDE54_32280 [Caldilineaceae bacterium]|nr:hypothetical protein [Caldilineaceae bacterium]MCB0096826.1 hypothetical protein [Caldilineaceae bacterium]MCB0144854.1 hypothetical protein [Caldilineaceae bacterium]